MEHSSEIFIRLHPEDMKTLADLIADRITQGRTSPEPLLNLRQLSEAIGIPYGTLAKKKLPCHRMGRRGRKMYLVSELLNLLKK